MQRDEESMWYFKQSRYDSPGPSCSPSPNPSSRPFIEEFMYRSRSPQHQERSQQRNQTRNWQHSTWDQQLVRSRQRSRSRSYERETPKKKACKQCPTPRYFKNEQGLNVHTGHMHNKVTLPAVPAAKRPTQAKPQPKKKSQPVNINIINVTNNYNRQRKY